jgi:uncharacterized membrane protein
MSRKEVFFISLTIFFTVLAWVVYDLLRIRYKQFSIQNFERILQAPSSFSTKTIEVLKQKEP